ncbi:hypothetical protein PAXRUDRAFT_216220 [Paxillus rubicundulus Ve08.2h10]|uniref:Uncharacterized protein n=1 Tax=Paxillus rubicundulus Ve08.2h10 TaxID=930991 RepID=A0A0D0EAL9_9AGAM|nr:hypothetical protein PAXRUDRAFT_216220 [Paxillus rubicundulus Ve08.2h10]
MQASVTECTLMVSYQQSLFMAARESKRTVKYMKKRSRSRAYIIACSFSASSCTICFAIDLCMQCPQHSSIDTLHSTTQYWHTR